MTLTDLLDLPAGTAVGADVGTWIDGRAVASKAVSIAITPAVASG